ncbi:sulfurtransferase [Streptomyces sp. NPDC006134]|uniref:sulfurtransferase n=1 Tax=Streptomyces sp. NPDC006134 TaxID=3154467 RepID=UPI0033F0357C
MNASPLPLAPVVDAGWLGEHRAETVLADVRWYPDGRSGHDAHLAGHLPGAVWVDVDTVLSAPPDGTGGRHPLPGPAAFARALGALGIGHDTTVVAYDDNGGAYAARLVWLLRRTGQPAALLDGGLAAWPGALETGPVTRDPVERTPVDWPRDLLRSADEVARAAAGTAVVLDARAPGRYSGADVLPTDVRSGHIPGARSAPWSANLSADGTFAPPEQLAAHYAALGARPGTEVIVYCGSGVTACHDLLALELAGMDTAALYPGSWSAWSAEPARPVATGPDDGPPPGR